MAGTAKLSLAIAITLTLFSLNALGNRYSVIPLEVSDAFMINNSNTVIATNPNGDPIVIEEGTIRKKEDDPDQDDETDRHYNPDEDVSILNTPGTPTEVHVIDINSPNNDPNSERIVGWFANEDGKRHGILWKKEDNIYKYELLPDYQRRQEICTGDAGTDASDCIAPGDIKTTIEEVQDCDNSIWDSWAEEDPFPINSLITECDKENEARSINDDGVIVGVSYRNLQCEDRRLCERAVMWTTEEQEDENKAADPIVVYVAQDIGVVFQNNKRISYLGVAKEIDRHGTTIAGELYNEDDGRYFPAAWFELSNEQAGFLPIEIVKNEDEEIYTGKVDITSISALGITGWYAGTGGLIRPVLWDREQNDNNQNVFRARDIPTLDGEGNGQVFQSSFVGKHVGGSGTDPSDYTAFVFSGECGPQNLNDLVATPNANLKLNKGLSITTELEDQLILASGTTIDTGEKGFYILRPEEKIVDLSVKIISDHQELVVGQEHTYTIELKNNGVATEPDSGNYATCVNIDILPNLDIPRGDGTSFTKSGGLDILNAQGTGNNTQCSWDPISVNCFIARLDPGANVTITLNTKPRPILASRTIKMTANVTSSETASDSSVITSVTNTTVTRQGCFIATAAYGSYLEPEVEVLRNFRDEFLLEYTVGEWIVDTYYQYSPPLAEKIVDSTYLRLISRLALTPIVYLVKYPLFISVLILTGLAVLRLQKSKQQA